MITYSVNIQGRDDDKAKLLHIGDRFYKVIRNQRNGNGMRTFQEPCPACNDSREIEYKGIKMPCGLCCAINSDHRKKSTSLTVHDYTVSEFIVHSVHIKGSTIKKNYSGENANTEQNLPIISTYEAFTNFNKYGITEKVSVAPRRWDQDIPEIEKLLKNWSVEEFMFTTKKKAEELREYIEQKEKERLKEFNRMHNTQYEWPFGK